MKPRVCCILPDGPRADLLRQKFHDGSSSFEKKYYIEIFAENQIEFGFDLYVCPWFMAGDLAESVSVLKTGYIAYGLAKYLPLAVAAGAADYLCEPWELDEFEYRCSRAIGSRIKELSWGSIIATGNQSSINGLPLNLTRGQHLFFQLLVANAGNALAYEMILNILCIRNPRSRVLSVYASELRAQIAGFVGRNPESILVNCYGQGYLLQA